MYSTLFVWDARNYGFNTIYVGVRGEPNGLYRTMDGRINISSTFTKWLMSTRREYACAPLPYYA